MKSIFLISIQIILGTLTIGPWAFVILYDILLYIWRASTYEIPIIGGRARGMQRPLIPSLTELPPPRTWSVSGMTYDGLKHEDDSAEGEYELHDFVQGEDEGREEVRNRKAYKDLDGNNGGASIGE